MDWPQTQLGARREQNSLDYDLMRIQLLHKTLQKNHPSIFDTHFILFKLQGARSYWSCHNGRRAAFWTCRQSFTGPHRGRQQCTLVPTNVVSLESLINRTCVSLDCGRKPEYPQTWADHANNAERLQLEILL